MSADWKLRKTERGFERIEFHDRYGKECSLQQSSLATFMEPGTSAIWLGCEHESIDPKDGGPLGGRMHLSLDQVKRLIPLLQKWVDDGCFGG